MIPRNIVYALVTFAVIVLHTGCSSGVDRDERLQNVVRIVSDNPREALDSLAAIDKSALSESDRHFHDFLTVKGMDKAFIAHTSDSVILDVTKYAKRHQREGYYPEALYYAGRVYHDMGDYPTALEYYQMSLDRIPNKPENLELRSRVLSQTGNLLDDLRLYEQAIPYVKESIEILRQIKDTVGEVLDLQMLGVIYLRAENLNSADSCFKTAISRSRELPPYHTAKSEMYLAEIKCKMGQPDSALTYIRTTIDKVRPKIRNTWLAYASDIYFKNSLYDTAFIYAHELIKRPESNNKGVGFNIIFRDSVRRYIPKDSLAAYASNYHEVIEKSFNEHQAQLAIRQQSNYNYSLHKREREKAERDAEILRYWMIGAVFFLLAMGWVILWFRYRDKKRIIELRVALENAEKLVNSINRHQSGNHISLSDESDNPENVPSDAGEPPAMLRERLRNKLCELYNTGDVQPMVPATILNSDSYKNLMDRIRHEKPIGDSDTLWDELEETVLECSPKFKDNLTLLVGGRLSALDLHTSLLIKCGVSPSEMTILLNRTKGAISSRRQSLCIKVLGEKKSTKTIDRIIRLL